MKGQFGNVIFSIDHKLDMNVDCYIGCCTNFKAYICKDNRTYNFQ